MVAVYVFRTEKLAWNHLVGIALLVGSVFFVFKKRQAESVQQNGYLSPFLIERVNADRRNLIPGKNS
ncbi:hypothetical protein [Rufibacter sp. XAAS-G3-1]|uniref:hypothetical protein n=1 Tax=Rufibacter sp. XAAS-G3-1 TaxID=2729134 RepID=UPI00351A2CEB